MNYQFIFFEEHFETLKTKNTISKNFTQESTKNLEREFYRITRVLRDIAIDLNSDKKAKSFLHFHQRSLIRLMDNVSDELSEIKYSQANTLSLKPLKLLFGYLESTLAWMISTFPIFFNKEEKVPFSIIEFETPKMVKQMEMICAQLAKIYSNEEIVRLTNMVLAPNQITSFRELDYWKLTIDSLYTKTASSHIGNEFNLLKFMLQLGLNHPALYDYLSGYIHLEIEKYETLNEQINAVCFYRKEIRQIFSLKTQKQFPLSSSVTKGIKRLLKQELLSLRALEFVNQEIDAAGMMNANYKVSFSVKQLAFFIHLQMETGIIIWQRAKYAHQYIARHFSTVERDSISEKSARNAHYNHAGEDIKKVILKLSEMLALAQEKY